MKRLLLLLCLLLAAFPAFCQWNSNPSVNNIMANTTGFELGLMTVSDGANGSIVFYEENDSHSFFAQKITAAGVIAWGTTTNPVLICTAPLWRDDIKAIPDGAGGAFVTWSDYRFDGDNGDIFIQHINSSGTSLWTSNGIRVTSTLAVDDYEPGLCSDGAGGVIIAWNGDVRGITRQMYSQRYNNAGTPQWAANGIQVCTAPGFRAGNAITTDGSNGAIIFFLDTRNDPHGLDYEYLDTANIVNADIFAQRLSGTGTLLWTGSGAAISTAAGNQVGFDDCVAASDGSGGAIIVFDDSRNDTPLPNGEPTNYDVFTQRVNSSGVTLWTANGLALSTAADHQYTNSVVSDGAGGAVVSWEDEAPGTVRSQKITGAGSLSWAVNGINVSSLADESYFSSVVADGLGNYIYCYNAVGTGDYIKAQKLNASGVQQWPASGAIVCNNADAYPDEPWIVLSDNGSIIVTWGDYRSFSTNQADIYTSKLLANGTLAGTVISDYITAANGNWNNPATWIGGVVPPAGAAVIIRHNVTVNVNASCYSVKVELPAGNVIVNTGIQFTVTH